MLMKKILLALSLSSLIASSALAVNADDVLGFWVTEENAATIEIFKDGDTYKGKMVWLKRIHDGEEKVLDVNNPSSDLKDRSLLGLQNLDGFKFKGDEWKDGEIYDPKKGKTYSAKMKLEKGKLHLRGYVGVPMFGRTAVWERSETIVPKEFNN